MELFLGLFASFAIGAAIMVIRANNPVYSVLYLILVFVNTSGILILQGLDFFAMIFLVVYVGAIAVLFLFVVMMLNVKVEEKEESILRYLPVGGGIGLIFFLEVILALDKDFVPLGYLNTHVKDSPLIPTYMHWGEALVQKTGIEAIGQVIYTYYFYYFFLASFILLVAMIGAILLTLHNDPKVKRQEVFEQNAREFSRTVQKAS
uniref:NADH-ubiquinone oxidoreductase chain 6 n=1 Tax=Chloropicon mariensis TaxID=1606511 RepID=A0A4D6C4M7_9CHLO|nr:NADH dehydrogenase subunit 6 [Chloropicon mariensis]QBX98706.1 NADH dehydrogenase subunit 6 [Chloropicon mariensis]